MAVDSLGAKRQPQFLDGGAPDVAVDPTAVADYAAEFGNYKVGTTADRTSASSWAWEGLLWRDTTDGILYERRSGAWKPVRSPWLSYTPTLTGFAVGTGGTVVAEYRYEGDLIRVRFKFTFGTSGQTFPSTPKLTLPVSSVAPFPWSFLNGMVTLATNAGASAPGWVIFDASSPTVVRLVYITGNSGTLAYDYPTPTTPIAFAAGSVMQGEFTYRPA